MNVVGYKGDKLKVAGEKMTEFYMNVVGYKVL